MVLVYIAGYNTRYNNQLSEYETHFYDEKYRKCTNSIDRGKLRVSSDLILFHAIKEKMCYE